MIWCLYFFNFVLIAVDVLSFREVSNFIFQVCLFLNFVITCACVRAYVLILFHRKEFFPLQWCQGHTWGCGSTILHHSRCFCQVPLSLFLKISYIETPARRQLDRKRDDILATCEKIIYIDIGYKSALNIYVPSKHLPI